MSFLKKYACLYGSLEFTPEEQTEIGAFAAEVMKLAASGRDEDLVGLFKREFEGIDETTFDRINRYMDFLSEFEKDAAGNPTAILAHILAPLSLALAATPLISQAVGAISRSFSLKASLKKAMEMHPELKSDQNIPMYFRAIADFAPDMAKNPIVVGNILSQMHRIGPSLLTPQLINELVGMQAKIPSKATEAAGTLGKDVMGLAGFYQKDTSKK
jgi:hypothetical protein